MAAFHMMADYIYILQSELLSKCRWVCQLFDLDLGFKKRFMYNRLLPHRGKMWTHAVLYTVGGTLEAV